MLPSGRSCAISLPYTVYVYSHWQELVFHTSEELRAAVQWCLGTKSRFLWGCLSIECKSLEYRECECVCICIRRKPARGGELANSTRFGIEPSTSLPQGDSANRHTAAAVGVIYRGSHFHSELVAARCAFVKPQRKFAYFPVSAAKRCRRLAGGTAEEAKDTVMARSAKVVWQRGWRRWQ